MAEKYLRMAQGFIRNGQIPAARTAINRAMATAPVGSETERKVKAFLAYLANLDRIVYL